MSEELAKCRACGGDGLQIYGERKPAVRTCHVCQGTGRTQDALGSHAEPRSQQRVGMRSADKNGAPTQDKLGLVGVGGVPKQNAKRYRCIVADPPWEYDEGFNTQPRSEKWRGPIVHDKPLPYPSMKVEEICALPVAALADTDCRLWLWTTGRYLPDAFRVMQAWGFRYRQTLVWHKADGNMGGGVAPNSAEFLLVGVTGNPPIKTKLKQSVHKLPQSKTHSRKPREWHWLIEQVDEGPRLEMFARRPMHGWSVWGNEVASDVELRAGGGGAELVGDGNAETQSRAASHTGKLIERGGPSAPAGTGEVNPP